MQPCNRIYYSTVRWGLNMFRAVCRLEHVEPLMNGGIINSITRLHLVGYLSWVILRCTDSCILNLKLVKGLSVLWKHLWRFMQFACLYCKQMFHITVLIHLLPVALKFIVFCHTSLGYTKKIQQVLSVWGGEVFIKTWYILYLILFTVRWFRLI
jgi:hypothetical protein